MRPNRNPIERAAASALAIAVATLAGTALAPAARAQSAVAPGNSYAAYDPEVVSGNVTYDRTGTPNTEVYTVNSPTAVLDFSPTDAGPGPSPIAFQAAGTTAIYQNGSGTSDFTVLNRIRPEDPSRAVQFDGTVMSRLIDASQQSAVGGTVWFYSPGGIIVGSTGAFDVGNLLLTTGDPTGGSGTISSTSSFTLNSTPDSGAAVQVLAGGKITTSQPGSYVALVAPAVIQQGTVSTDGAAAYVAAEQTTLTFSSGLFDIQTTVGSNANSNQPLVHEGTTRFIDDAGPRTAYLVAVPKNDAITLLVQGTGKLGFDTATGVTIDNGTVVLAADADITGPAATPYYRNSGLAANVLVLGGTFNATGRIAAGSGSFLQSDNPISFAGNLDAHGELISSFVSTTADLTIAGNLTAQGQSQSKHGGTIDIVSNGGAITIGNADSIHNLVADSTPLDQPAQDVAAGSVTIFANAGNVTINGVLNVNAWSSNTAITGGTGGLVSGGTIVLGAADGNKLQFTGSLNTFASGYGGAAAADGATAGAGAGGSVVLSVSNGGQLSVAYDAKLAARGVGGDVTSGNGQAGSGTGGSVQLYVDGNGSGITIGNLEIDTSAAGGNADATGVTGNAGDAYGGSATIYAAPGTQNVTASGGGVIDIGTQSTNLSAVGGNSSSGTGGGAQGGSFIVTSLGATIRSSGGIGFNADAQAGAGPAGGGATASGGYAAFEADGGTIDLASVTGTARATVGEIGVNVDGGAGQGGSISFLAHGAGSLTVGGATSLDTSAVGGDADTGDGQAGPAAGGDVSLMAQSDGTLSLGATTIFARAIGGNALASGIVGGGATGGQITLGQDSGGQVTVGDASFDASATGGATRGGSGIGADAMGGDVRFASTDGTVHATGTLSLLANGTGGDGTLRGGNGTGGYATVETDTGSTTVDGLLTVQTDGTGGDGSGSGSVNGNGNGSTGDGGRGYGGIALVATTGDGSVALNDDAELEAWGSGGTGANGGDATGGTATFSASNGSIAAAGTALLSVRATGGLATGDLAAGKGVEGADLRGVAQLRALGGRITAQNATLVDSGTSPNPEGEFSQVLAQGGSVTIADTLMADVGGDFGLFGEPVNGVAGSIETTQLVINAGNTVLVDDPNAPGASTVDAITVNDSALLTLGGNLELADPIEIPGTFTAYVGGSISMGSILSGGGTALTAGGDVTTGQLGSYGDISVDALGSVSIGQVPQATSLTVNAGGSIAIGGDVTVSGPASFSSEGLASFDGIISAPQIAVISNDIEIGSNGSLGAAGTNTLLIGAIDTLNSVTFGGDGSADGYDLSGAEAARLHAHSIVFTATNASGPARITVDDFTLQGSAAGNNANLLGSQLVLAGDGIRVVGDAQIANAGIDDSFTLATVEGGTVEVVTDAGGRLRVLDSDGLPTGSLQLVAGNVWVGTSDLLNRLADTSTTFNGISDAAAVPDGTARPEGNLIAGVILTGATSSIVIQNSNTSALRGGFTAGSQFLLATDSTTPGSTFVAINGRIGDDAGGFFTNAATAGAVSFDSQANAQPFSADSTVNGCPLSGGTCNIFGPDTGDLAFDDSAVVVSEVREIGDNGNTEESGASDEEEEKQQEAERAAEVAPTEATKKSPIVQPISVVDSSPLTVEPSIDDPVAGTQNPNFRVEPTVPPAPSGGAGDK